MRRNSGTIAAWLTCLVLLFGVGSLSCAEEIKKKEKPEQLIITMDLDHPDAMYACGEAAVFTASLTRKTLPITETEVMFVLSIKGAKKPLREEKVLLDEQKKASISMTLEKPGVLICEVTCQDLNRNRKVDNDIGAAFDLEKIRPVTVMPPDFDEFWKSARKEVAAIPPDMRMKKLEQSTKEVDVFKISFANVMNSRIYGYLSIPKDKEAPFPVFISVPGAGPGLRGPQFGWAKKGAIELCMNVHAYDILPYDGDPPPKGSYSGDYPRGGIPGHDSKKPFFKPDKRNCFFYRAFLGIDRAINYVVSRPDADRSRVVIQGSSQGGGFALVLAGLNADICTAVSARSPVLCDALSYLDGRSANWPGIIPRRLWFTDNEQEKSLQEFSKYFDAVNFARKITFPAIFAAGLRDTTCKAANIYSAYNLVQAPKRMFMDPRTAHKPWPKGYHEFRKKWTAGQLGFGELIPPNSETTGKGK